MNLDPRHLIQLSVIVELGSFSQAAESLCLTQPALSRNMRLLEDRVGARLIDRTSKQIAATDIGRAFVDQGRTIRQATTQAAQLSRQVDQGEVGQLRLGVSPLISEYMISKPLSLFLAQHPKVTCTITTALICSLREQVANGELDIAIGPTTMLDSHSGLQAHELWRDTVHIFCNARHRLAQKANISLSDLQAARWIGHSEPSLLKNQMESFISSSGIDELDIAIEIDSPITNAALLHNSDYLTMLPYTPMQRLISSGALAEVAFHHHLPARPTGLITRRTASTPALINTFSSFIAANFLPQHYLEN